VKENRWTSYVARMWNKNALRALVGKREEERPLEDIGINGR
jgi:hypothetical protein